MTSMISMTSMKIDSKNASTIYPIQKNERGFLIYYINKAFRQVKKHS